MLWTDRDFITADDLATLDGEISDVASAESIVIQDDIGNSIIHRSIEESGDKLLKYLQVFGGYLSSGSVSANHNAAVFNTGMPAVNRCKVLVGQVVVTGLNARVWTAVKRWASYRALASFYRSASNRTLKDRYVDKERRYRSEADMQHWDAVRTQGVPVIQNPLPCPGAVWEPNAGIWSSDNVTLPTGAGTLSTSLDVAVTYIDQTQPVTNNESATSALVTVQVSPGSVVSVSVASLVPPNGTQHPGTIPFAVVQYMKATAWNVYVGNTGGPLYLQNNAPIAIATKTFTLPGDPVLTGTVAGPGQWPDRYLTLGMGQLQRG